MKKVKYIRLSCPYCGKGKLELLGVTEEASMATFHCAECGMAFDVLW